MTKKSVWKCYFTFRIIHSYINCNFFTNKNVLPTHNKLKIVHVHPSCIPHSYSSQQIEIRKMSDATYGIWGHPVFICLDNFTNWSFIWKTFLDGRIDGKLDFAAKTAVFDENWGFCRLWLKSGETNKVSIQMWGPKKENVNFLKRRILAKRKTTCLEKVTPIFGLFNNPWKRIFTRTFCSFLHSQQFILKFYCYLKYTFCYTSHRLLNWLELVF